MTDLRADLDIFAAAILKKAQAPETSLDDQIRAFKVVATYNIGIVKLDKKSGDADDGAGFSFDDAKDEIDAANGRTN